MRRFLVMHSARPNHAMRRTPKAFASRLAGSIGSSLPVDAANRWPLRITAFDDFHIESAAPRSRQRSLIFFSLGLKHVS